MCKKILYCPLSRFAILERRVFLFHESFCEHVVDRVILVSAWKSRCNSGINCHSICSNLVEDEYRITGARMRDNAVAGNLSMDLQSDGCRSHDSVIIDRQSVHVLFSAFYQQKLLNNGKTDDQHDSTIIESLKDTFVRLRCKNENECFMTVGSIYRLNHTCDANDLRNWFMNFKRKSVFLTPIEFY